ncbi:hypothetical protein OV079_40940 [Nannocystis pusilla]|uniref:Uncharacterized protein n=1 Tax=Nannocystis pusilla TaxID=889268 RepID=A0A9X3J0L3_9BACT|nr:hypothetical protein [Nannocystis pusilla]MCY1011817.1 hypothetical protein [Nannocystis pusilla]
MRGWSTIATENVAPAASTVCVVRPPNTACDAHISAVTGKWNLFSPVAGHGTDATTPSASASSSATSASK